MGNLLVLPDVGRSAHQDDQRVACDHTHEGAPVTVTYTQPDGTTINDHVTTLTTDNALDGSYFDSVTPEQPSTWTIQSAWPGDATYDGKYSNICEVTVSPEPPR